MNVAVDHYLAFQKTRIVTVQERIHALDPIRVLQRGYALVQDRGGALITAVKQVKLNQEVAVQLADGSFAADVKQIYDKDGKQD